MDEVDYRFDSMYPGIELVEFVLGDKSVQELLMAFLLLRPQRGDLSEEGAACFAHELKTGVKILELLIRRPVI